MMNGIELDNAIDQEYKKHIDELRILILQHNPDTDLFQNYMWIKITHSIREPPMKEDGDAHRIMIASLIVGYLTKEGYDEHKLDELLRSIYHHLR